MQARSDAQGRRFALCLLPACGDFFFQLLDADEERGRDRMTRQLLFQLL